MSHLTGRPIQTYRAGEYYDTKSCGYGCDNYASQSTATGTIYIVPFYVDINHTFDRIGIEKVSGAGTGVNLRLGVYDDADNRPNNLLLDTEVTNFDTNGGYESTISLRMGPGKCWLAYMVTASRSVRAVADMNGRSIGIASLTDTNTNKMLTGTQAYGSMPLAVPALTLSTLNILRILLRG